MSSFLRARQRTMTGLFPHPGNRTHLIPNRPISQFVLGRKLLLFAVDTFVTVTGFVLDDTKQNTIEYSVRIDNLDANRIPFSFLTGSAHTVLFTPSGMRVNRGGVNSNVNEQFVPGVVYIPVQEIVVPVGTLEYVLAPGQTSTVSVGTTGLNTDLLIGKRGSDGWVGIIADFKVFDNLGALQNHWVIDDDVIDGGTIVDVAGGQDGILTLGSGSWVDAPGLPP